MLAGHQCKVKMSGSEKKVNENAAYDISYVKRVTRKFLGVSLCSCAEQRQTYKKSVVHVQRCLIIAN